MIPGEPWAAPQVIDENFGQTGKRAESKEAGPWGGIPGIVSEFAQEKQLNYQLHIEAISATSLQKNYEAAPEVITRAGWQAVVLQEISTKPLPFSLTMSSVSNPPGFWNSVETIEQAVHAVTPQASIYLYETWPRGDLARQLAGDPMQPGFGEKYMNALGELGDVNLASYECAAQRDGKIAGLAPVGEAWRRTWSDGLANPDPFQSSSLPLLWYGINAVNDPPIKKPDYLHPSVYGAYLSGLVLFVEMTGVDVRTLGASEQAAARFGIPGEVAAALQRDAWLAVEQLQDTSKEDPCSLVEAAQ
jgi:hypothetical protein